MRTFAILTAMLLPAVAHGADWKDTALTDLRGEPKIVEAMFTGASSLWVSVRDDGTNRDGFAEYVCNSLHFAGMPQGDFYVIHIWDAAKMASGENVELGRSECSKN